MTAREHKAVCYGFNQWCGKPVEQALVRHDHPYPLCDECLGKRELQRRALAPPYGDWFAAEERPTR
jgi:hypothetical protein